MQETSVNAAKNPSVPRTETGNIKLNAELLKRKNWNCGHCGIKNSAKAGNLYFSCWKCGKPKNEARRKNITAKSTLLDDPEVWGAMIAAKFAREMELPHGNYWEPVIAKILAKLVREGTKTRDQVELLMALQLGIARTHNGQLHYQGEVYDAVQTEGKV